MINMVFNALIRSEFVRKMHSRIGIIHRSKKKLNFARINGMIFSNRSIQTNSSFNEIPEYNAR